MDQCSLNTGIYVGAEEPKQRTHGSISTCGLHHGHQGRDITYWLTGICLVHVAWEDGSGLASQTSQITLIFNFSISFCSV